MSSDIKNLITLVWINNICHWKVTKKKTRKNKQTKQKNPQNYMNATVAEK